MKPATFAESRGHAVSTHQGSFSDAHLQAYLEEFTFRFNLRRSKTKPMDARPSKEAKLMRCDYCNNGERQPVRRARLAEKDGRTAVVLDVPVEV